MPLKPVLATFQDLQDAEAKLDAFIKKVEGVAAQATQATEAKWRVAVQDLQVKIDANEKVAAKDVVGARAEAKQYTEDCVSGLNTQLLTMFPPIWEEIKRIHEDVLVKLDDQDTKLQQLVVDEMSGLAEQFDNELKEMKIELQTNIESFGREAAQALVEQCKIRDVAIEVLRVECQEARAKIIEASRVRFEQILKDQVEVDVAQDAVREALRAEQIIYADRVWPVIAEKEEIARLETIEAAAVAKAALGVVQEDCLSKQFRLYSETAQLRDGLREVENVTTRRVEWVIKQAQVALKPPAEGWSPAANSRSWYSPKFNAAGAFGLQLELQLYGPPPSKRDTEHVEHNTGSGNLGVYLWACKGTRCAMKLYIGERAAPLEKKFDGRSSCGTGRLCFLKDQIDKHDGTLRVGVEFLEAMREVEYPIFQSGYSARVPPPPLSLTGKDHSEVDPLMKAIIALDGEDPLMEAIIAEEEATPLTDTQLNGSLCYMRHLNHRTFEQVEAKVSGMESRMVRKVQWKVMHASRLREYFPWGQAICSPCFSASGIENMQLALYPSGYGGVTDGFCSVFLYAPAGCTLRVFLSLAGGDAPQVRELNHSWESAGAFGRTNFCLFEKVIDMVDDSCTISLEIEEAQQDVCTPWTHKESAPRGEDSHHGSGDSVKLESITKLTRNPGKAPNGRSNGREGKMDSGMHLASIWTAKAFSELGQADKEIPQNFHSFDSVLKRTPMTTAPDNAKPRSAGAAKRSKSPKGDSPTSGYSGSRSAPALHPSSSPAAAGRTAMQEDLTPPLPPVSAGSITLGSATGGWDMQPPGGASSYGQAQKAEKTKRNRPGSSGATTRFGATS